MNKIKKEMAISILKVIVAGVITIISCANLADYIVGAPST